MKITYKDPMNICNAAYVKTSAILALYDYIKTHKVTKLNNYLVNNKYGSLLNICTGLIKRCSVIHIENAVVIRFLSRKDDTIAQLITYGNSELEGTNILREIFGEI